MTDYLIWHPERNAIHDKSEVYAYADPISNGHNQDPYIWNRKFLYSYCKLNSGTGTSKKLVNCIKERDRLFFVSSTRGDMVSFVKNESIELIVPKNGLRCDLVFEVEKKVIWEEECLNRLQKCDLPNDLVGDLSNKDFSFSDHFGYCYEHPKLSPHVTFIAKENSFQPQSKENCLEIYPNGEKIWKPIRIEDFFYKELEGKRNFKGIFKLNDYNVDIVKLKWKCGSCPRILDSSIGDKLYHYICEKTEKKKSGECFFEYREKNKEEFTNYPNQKKLKNYLEEKLRSFKGHINNE